MNILSFKNKFAKIEKKQEQKNKHKDAVEKYANATTSIAHFLERAYRERRGFILSATDFKEGKSGYNVCSVVNIEDGRDAAGIIAVNIFAMCAGFETLEEKLFALESATEWAKTLIENNPNAKNVSELVKF